MLLMLIAPKVSAGAQATALEVPGSAASAASPASGASPASAASAASAASVVSAPTSAPAASASSPETAAASSPNPQTSASPAPLANSGQEASPPAESTQLDTFAVGTLWRVTAPNGSVGHVFGTIHIGNPGELAVPPRVWTLIDSAKRVVVEVASDRMDPRESERLQRLPAGDSLDKHLSRREMETLRQRWLRAGLPVAPLARYKPWVSTQLLQAASHAAVHSLDDRIIERARRGGIEVLPLEAPREQFSSFECIGLADQIVLLKETLTLPEAFFHAVNRDVLALYRRQRIGDLVQLLITRFPDDPAARDADARSTRCVIVDRNRRFAERLPALLGRAGSFVGIGAAHLVGRDGVLKALAGAGFQLERLADEGVTP